MKRAILRFLTYVFFLISGFMAIVADSLHAQKAVKTIIVDAGHGRLENGGYHGAKGSYSWEDQICLAVAKEVVKLLNAEFPEIRVVETRPTERFVSNVRRAEIANENNGDLFLCIHVNSAPPIRHATLTGYKTITTYVGKGKNRKKVTRKVPQYRYTYTPNPARGTETYIWGAHKNENKELALRENASVMDDAHFKAKYGDVDVNSPEFIALSLLKTKQYFKRSAMLASFVQEEFAQVGRVDRSVKQREVGIWVLQATAMPSVLIETGFISNPDDERYLNSKEGQKELAECILRAVRNYISWLDAQQSNVETTFTRLPNQ